ncbi:hypothetical protein DVH24_005705 [Malus domestica]|uniref:Late embryogenesis abundant protein LEA-2 subgroup domain-containing protein n=1 Tax=Malus domestica TaxID=3750 RepID=A0A498INB2_MALDO|nr:TGF-beta-activated kinase 1 and MAP3K7-binding protein 3-like [Malus domestica]RXH83452.1 hypothetical protein DVH24_005705 [Malus domestica]
MAQAMVRLGLGVFLVILSMLVGAEATAFRPKTKKVWCEDTKFYKCYHIDLYCPAACPSTCFVDCKTCKPVCQAPRPPPPRSPPPPPPPPPPPKHRRSPPPPKAYPRSPPPPPKAYYRSPPPKAYQRSPPPPPKAYYRSPPPPKAFHPSHPPPPKAYHHSPPPPKAYHHSPPPPKAYHHSPPPPPKAYHHSPPPPPKAYYHSPPPPPKTYPSPPPPPLVVPTPPPSTTTPPPPPTSTPSSPPPPTSTPSSPPPPTSTPSSPLPPTSMPSPPLTPPSPPPPTSTPSSYPPPPPSSESPGEQRVKCKNKNYPQCYGLELTCPSACPHQCEVDCVTCSPVCNCNKPGAVCQDPRFIGGDGITFYFHGKRDQDFCIVSDSNLHINAHFIGKRYQTMKRDFTWVQSLGILFGNHKLYIGAKTTSTWDDSNDRLSLSVDGQTISLPDSEGANWQSILSAGALSITRTKNTNSVEIEAEGNFKIKAVVVPITEKESLIHNYGVTEEDCFAHLDLSFKFYALSGEVSGVLGQTYASNYVSRVKMGVVMPVLGGDKEFASSTIFASDCEVARFTGEIATNDFSNNYDHYASTMNCASGVDGRGVVCKR